VTARDFGALAGQLAQVKLFADQHSPRERGIALETAAPAVRASLNLVVDRLAG
jgi:hypothetical protein